jgi:hypothetical protein
MVRSTLRSKRINDRVIDRLRQNIFAGLPHRQPQTPDEQLGYADLIYLQSGLYYPVCNFIHDKNDVETLNDLWWNLREDLLTQHIKRHPGTRCWAWWHLEQDREQRRVVGLDRDEDEENGHGDERLPAFEDPSLPAWARGKTYFGRPSVYDGHVYETQREYLARLHLLTPAEKKIFRKYGDVVTVRIAPGIWGQCAGCWEKVRKIAGELGFDLDAVIKFDQFWIPEALFFDCDHEERFHGNDGIFEEMAAR